MTWIWHAHRWVEHARTFVPPVASLPPGFECSEDLFQRLAAGVTTFVFRCERCGKLKVIEMLGIVTLGAVPAAHSDP